MRAAYKSKRDEEVSQQIKTKKKKEQLHREKLNKLFILQKKAAPQSMLCNTLHECEVHSVKFDRLRALCSKTHKTS